MLYEIKEPLEDEIKEPPEDEKFHCPVP